MQEDDQATLRAIDRALGLSPNLFAVLFAAGLVRTSVSPAKDANLRKRVAEVLRAAGVPD